MRQIRGDLDTLFIQASAAKIVSILTANGYISKFDTSGSVFSYWPNPSRYFITDEVELQLQADNSSSALILAQSAAYAVDPSATISASSPEYKVALGNLYFNKISNAAAASENEIVVYSVVKNLGAYVRDAALNKGKKLIIVSHSQGNFMAEAVDAYIRHGLLPSDSSVLTRNVKYVGAASAAASTPNNRYISASEDIS